MSDSYRLNPDFEKIVLWQLASHRQTWLRVGHALNEKSFSHPLAKHILGAVRSIAEETGSGPDSTLITVQRLCSIHARGKLSEQDLNAINDLSRR